MMSIWDTLAPNTQDAIWACALLLPAIATGWAVMRGFRALPLSAAMLKRFRWTNMLFVLLISIAVGTGLALIAQERGLRKGTAHSADKFDLIMAAPGSETTMLLATVFLQPSDVPLLNGAQFNEIYEHDSVALAAPLAFGDSFNGHPVIGTTAEFVEHLSGARLEGRVFGTSHEAIIGAKVPLEIGDYFTPAHGHGDAASDEHDIQITVTGQMARSGTPWDRAILVAVESVWETHGLANGHAPEKGMQIGPPFDASYFPGTPAIITHADALWANYALRSEFTRDDMMAFFPGAVLMQLYAIMGDIRQAMSALTLATQGLVATSILVGLLLLIRLLRRQLALLSALGAPRRFGFAVIWSYATILLVIGALLGALVAQVMALLLSEILTNRTNIAIHAPLGWTELHLLAGFISLSSLLALLPASATLRLPIVPALRS